MTDQEVLAVLDRLEALLATPTEIPNGAAVADWHAAFQGCVARAERGPRWPEVQARARVLRRLLNRRMALIRAAQAERKRELAKVATGRRALNAYRT
jgi:hypothetical protein